MVQQEESLPHSGWLTAAARNHVYYISLICTRGRGPDELEHFVAQGKIWPGILSVQSTTHGVQNFTVLSSLSLKGICQHHKMFLFNIYSQSPTGRLAYQKQAEGIK